MVTLAVTTETKQLMTDMAAKTVERKAELDVLKEEVQLQTFELDRLEQSSRHESIRIRGIDETAGEDTDSLVQELAADIGVTLKPEDISVSHRLPGRPGSTRPIIVKFVRSNTKTVMMKSKSVRRWHEFHANDPSTHIVDASITSAGDADGAHNC